MKKLARGAINEQITAVANPVYPGYLVRGEGKNLMIEAGMNLMAPLYLQSIGDLLGDPGKLDYLFITHSHYDHLGAAPYLMSHIPGLRLGAHERVGELLAKESVLAMMNRLSEIQRPLFGEIAGEEDLRIRPVAVDCVLRDGDEFDLGGVTCRVYETPGHTRDSLSFYLPETGVLFPGEAAGVPQGKRGEGVQVEFLSSYDDYLASLEKIIALDPKVLCIGHAWVFTGEDTAQYLRESRDATYAYRRLIEGYLDDSGGDVDRAVLTMTQIEYDESGEIFQERNAYVTNLDAQVRHVAGLR
ncbi:MAG: MBL fold metallo-hydrolase [Spirochaetes bacterium]|nr:MBL fold metallo-hydrolase [Spirochaetota bacterium]